MIRMFGFRMPRILMDQDAGGGNGGDDPGKDPGDPPGGDDPGQEGKSEREKELEKALADKDGEIENLKKQQKGEYKRGQDLQKQIDELKKAQMSDEERKKADEEERQKKDKESRDQFLGECTSLAAERAGVGEDDHFLLSGNNQEEIFKKGTRFKELIAEAEQRGYDNALKDKFKGTPPGSGNPPGGDGKPKLGSTVSESLKNLS